MKDRFSKLLLGDDMTGRGNGVCTALAISNAITNLSGLSHFPLVPDIQSQIDIYRFISDTK